MKKHMTTIYYAMLVDRCVEAMNAGALRHEAVEAVADEYGLRDDQVEIMVQSLYMRLRQVADAMYAELMRMHREFVCVNN